VADAVYVRDGNEWRQTADAAVSVREVWQLSDGRAAVYAGRDTGGSGTKQDFTTDGHYTMPKASGFVGISGSKAYWDHSANNVSFRKVNDRDFYLGTFVGDTASGDASCVVNLNNLPRRDIVLSRDGFKSVLVGTPAAGGFGYPVNLGGSLVFELTSTSEAQKVDALSTDGFAVAANWIVEGDVRVISDGAGSNPDFTIGVANGTHASEFQTVGEFVALHLDGNAVDIFAESDDGSTDVAPTDTTVNYSEGSEVANRFHFLLDGRNPSDVQVYVDGVLVLGATVFTLAAAVGPLFLVVHLEKTSSADVYKIAVDDLNVRFMEQDSTS
jgi:predicted RecA/RadA family phage recombinase